MRFSFSCIPNQTERLIFAKINKNLLDKFYIYSKQKEIYDHLEFKPFSNIKETSEYLSKLQSRIDTGKADYRFLLNKEKDEILGLFGMHSYDDYRKSVEFGYGVSPKHQRKGFFTEAASHLISNLFLKTNLHRIYAYTSKYNISSCRSLEKIGFKKEGIIRDYYFKDYCFFDAVLYSVIKT
tara:strand:+ start:17434 stop:17976 length:543 start_codon:yes stop_codon:yes gene_type:complete